MSKKTGFSGAQNDALRVALVALYEERSQSEIATVLEIAQQNVGRLLRDERAGFAYSTATRLARLAGYSGVDAFFAAKVKVRRRKKAEPPAESGSDVAADARAAS